MWGYEGDWGSVSGPLLFVLPRWSPQTPTYQSDHTPWTCLSWSCLDLRTDHSPVSGLWEPPANQCLTPAKLPLSQTPSTPTIPFGQRQLYSSHSISDSPAKSVSLSPSNKYLTCSSSVLSQPPLSCSGSHNCLQTVFSVPLPLLNQWSF